MDNQSEPREPLMTDLQWMRNRAWVQHELDASGEGDSLYHAGYHMAMLKVWGRMFLSDDERAGVEQARIEMGF